MIRLPCLTLHFALNLGLDFDREQRDFGLMFFIEIVVAFVNLVLGF